VAAAAADALGELGEQLHAATSAGNGAEAGVEAGVARALSAALQRTAGGNPGTQQLRESCVRAMAALRDPLLMRTFLDLVRGNESAAVHMYAVRGLGGLKDPRMAPTIEDLLSRDNDPGVRLAAVQALGGIAAPEYAGQMVDLMSEPGSDDSLRQAAWEALRKWFAQMDDTQIQSVADELHEKLPQQPDKQLGALQALAAKLQKEPGAGNDLAGTRQQIGDLLMQLQQPADAAVAYKQALDYWKSNNGTGMTVERLTQDLMDSLLQAKQYDDAAAFAAASLANNTNARIVAVPLRDTAQKLAAGGDIADAQAMIAAIDKMSPPLPEPYLGDVEQTKAQLNRH
jgi:HEAT repeat protein